MTPESMKEPEQCWVRACKANHDGKCTHTKEEWLNNPCALLWFLSGQNGKVKDILAKAEMGDVDKDGRV